MTTIEHDLRTAWQTWHAEREKVLREPHGWLSLTALHWLDANPASIPGLPGTWRVRDADTVEIAEVTATEDVRLPDSDEPVDGSATMRPVDGLPGAMVSVGDPLVALPGKQGGLLLHFRDATSGRESYGGGRTVPVGDPDADGTVTVDLNRTVNLPCAFTDHATCPLPPAGNTMTVAVEAGEKTP